jgi:Chloramphenicol phosphotransferase-like protein
MTAGAAPRPRCLAVTSMPSPDGWRISSLGAAAGKRRLHGLFPQLNAYIYECSHSPKCRHDHRLKQHPRWWISSPTGRSGGPRLGAAVHHRAHHLTGNANSAFTRSSQGPSRPSGSGARKQRCRKPGLQPEPVPWRRGNPGDRAQWRVQLGKAGMAASQAEAAHRGIVYDLEVDTTHAEALECAQAIAARRR